MPFIRVSVADPSGVREVLVRVPAVGEGPLLAVAGGQELRRMRWGGRWSHPGYVVTVSRNPVALPLVVPSFDEWAVRCAKERILLLPDPEATGCETPRERAVRAARKSALAAH